MLAMLRQGKRTYHIARRTDFDVELFIKALVKRIEVLRVERISDEPQGFAEMINFGKSS